jgi:hypothetical protein
VAIAASAAVSVAFSVVILSRTVVPSNVDIARVPVAILALQMLAVTALLVGFRHGVRLPAELRANWAIQLAWSGDERPYLAGVKRAGLVVLAAPPLLVVCASLTSTLGVSLAIEHLACGVIAAAALMELLFLDLRLLPFASGYVPTEGATAKALYGAVLVTGIFSLAALERRALVTSFGELVFLLCFAAALLGLRMLDRARRRTRVEIDFDAHPSDATQRLELVR